MAQNAKTPVMVLQELAVKKGFGPPNYQIILEVSGSHQNRFDYSVTVAGIQATGSGSSKRIGKHQAAYNALMKLQEMGIYVPAENPVANSFKVPLRDENSRFQPAPNSLVDPNTKVEANKLPGAESIEVSNVGPAHEKESTFDCKMGALTTTATPSTKKMAKQIAETEMIEKTQELRLVEEEQSSDVRLDSQLTDAIRTYRELTKFPKPDRSLNIDELDHALAKLMNLKHLTYNDFKEDLKIPTEESLNKILDRLEVRHSFVQIRADPVIVSFSLKIDSPFTLWEVGETYEEAKRHALEQGFRVMDQMMQIEI